MFVPVLYGHHGIECGVLIDKAVVLVDVRARRLHKDAIVPQHEGSVA